MAINYRSISQAGYEMGIRDTDYILAGVTINGPIAFNATDPTNATLFVNGTINGSVTDTPHPSGHDRIVVGATGGIYSTGAAISIGGGGNTVFNAGTLLSAGPGNVILIDGTRGFDAGATNYITNTGTIGAYDDPGFNAIEITGPGDTNFSNSGTIYGSIQFEEIAPGPDANLIINTGTIFGSVNLGNARAIFDTSLGIVTGSISSGNGSDDITGSVYDDDISTGDGNDFVNGGRGGDSMYGGDGRDTYYLDDTDDYVSDSSGIFDSIVSRVSVDLLDDMQVSGDIEQVSLRGGANLSVSGAAGMDAIFGNSGMNVIDGRDGNDNLQGKGGADTLLGGMGNDVLIGGIGADKMVGGDGNDIYVIDDAGDLANETGATGVDEMRSSVSVNLSDKSLTRGDIENISLLGSSPIDATGSALANSILGNTGSNLIDGLKGNDTINLTLGGSDIVAFTTALSAASNLDTVTGFSSDDIFALDDAIFTAFTAAGEIAASAFATGSFSSADQHILYRVSGGVGKLYYDADGSGAGSASVQFAVLTDLPALSAANFFAI